VTQNHSEKSINNMLDFIEKNAEDEAANSCIEKFYSLTLDSFHSTNNERLWLKTNIKLARLWFAQKNYRLLADKLRDLHKACQKEDGTDDPSKGTLSLEVYALEIQMYAETRNNKRLKVRYSDCFQIGTRIANLIVGSLSTRTSSQVRGATSKNHGNHSRVWWKDAYE
jgi:COP9 signalosome complex subunit 2